MGQLELIWKLEHHNKALEIQNKELELLNNNIKVVDMLKNVSLYEVMLKDLSGKIKDGRMKLKNLDKTFNDFIYRLDEINKELYNGEVSDLKQLTYLCEEKEKINEHINNMETEILLLMEEMEMIENDYQEIEEDLTKINKNIIYTKEKDSILTLELGKSMDIEKDCIKNIENQIDDKILYRYNTLREKRGSGIVPIIDYICGGCNMRVPTYLGESLKNKKEIIYCESCGRILYFMTEKEVNPTLQK